MEALRVHKTGPKGEGDNSQIDQHEGKVGIYRGKRDVSEAGKDHGG
jgi:hypothetical protein